VPTSRDLPFRDALHDRLVLFDGAMGTEIYARGVFINRSYDELSLSGPEMVREIHESYLAAGAEVLTTNTFGANRVRLAPFGLADRAADINRAAVRVARGVAGAKAWVGGSMGPVGVPLAPVGKLSPGDAYQVFREQAQVLAEEGVDLFLLETFADVSELWQAVRAVRSVCDLPIVGSMTFPVAPGLAETRVEGISPERAVAVMNGWKLDAIGVNCSMGPRGVLSVVERLVPLTETPIVAMPNAGLPQVVDGRTIYLAGPEYMAEHARRLAQVGARGIGGCCGTTPRMIKEMRTFLRSISPVHRGPVSAPAAAEGATEAQGSAPVPVAERSEFAKRLLSGKFCVSVELDPPRGVDPAHAVEGAAALHAAGIDVVNIADGPRAVARMGPSALSQLVRARTPGMETVVHYCCRDRNLLGMQMDLLGAHALGLRNILAVTGDPPKMGTYPDATAVFDIDSIGLISFIQLLNRGLDFAGQPIGGQTALFVGAGCNPGAVDLDVEAERYARKVDAGAEFFFSQPVFDEELLSRFLDRTAGAREVPFLVGIMPLVSLKNAEFLHNEVPGMQIPDAVMRAMRAAPSRDAQREVGVQVAREALLRCRAHPRVRGVYVYPPFGSYKAVLRLLEGILEPTPPTEA
jgi:methionine synthase I (cobalamin-dependent)/5,10-methylenetetrahydrofolate reductase